VVEESWARWWQWRGKVDALKMGRDVTAINVSVGFHARPIDNGA
jgi:hypothetical protein